MSTTPIIAHKRQSTGSQPSLPIVAQGPNKAQRKVLSRRKALKEFYHLNAAEQGEAKAEAGQPEREPELVDVLNPESLSKLIKTGSIEEILRTRNEITNQLNSHDLEQKSIIYDNYYELIKLSQTLGSLNESKPKQDVGLLITVEDAELVDTEKVFTELETFLHSEALKFSGSFDKVISELQQEIDDASIKGIAEKPESESGPSIDKTALQREITTLLNVDPASIDAKKKAKLVSGIQNVLKKLHIHKDELLILQLNKVKAAFQ